MKQKRYRWVGFFVTTLLVVPFLLVGCPKRPEIAETTPKAIGPQGAIAMPGPALPSPPTVSAVPPTVPALEEKSPPEVTTAQSQETEAAREGRVEEAEVPPDQGAEAPPGAPAAPEPGPAEAGVKPGAGVKETDVMSGASPSAAESEVKPETATPVKEAEAAPGSETLGRARLRPRMCWRRVLFRRRRVMCCRTQVYPIHIEAAVVLEPSPSDFTAPPFSPDGFPRRDVGHMVEVGDDQVVLSPDEPSHRKGQVEEGL